MKSGDVIDVLDDSSLQQQLEQKQAQIASSEKLRPYQLKLPPTDLLKLLETEMEELIHKF